MADPSSNSFIPKRGPIKRKRGSVSRQVYVFTLISYILVFASLLAAGGVYFYAKYVDRQFDDIVVELGNEVKSFSEADMQEVLEFDLRLAQASDRLDNSVSIVSVFEALEDATIDTVQVSSLNLERMGDERFLMDASIVTDTFDSTIFQRGVYKRNSTIDSISITELNNEVAVKVTDDEDGQNRQSESDDEAKPTVTFTAEIDIPLSKVPYELKEIPDDEPLTITNPVTETEVPANTEEAPDLLFEDNQDNI